jgi:prolyl oligopeptidase
VHKDWLVLELREPYEAGGKTYKPGSLIATDFNAFMAGKREFTTLFEPTDNSSLAGYTWTKDYLVLNVMEDVKNRLFVLTPGKMWSKRAVRRVHRPSAPSAWVRWTTRTATRCG